MKYKKVVIGSYFTFCALIWYVVSELTKQIGGYFQLFRRLPGKAVILEVFPIGIAGIVFVVLLRQKVAASFFDEVVGELTRVTWPIRKELIASTLVAIVMMILSGAMLGLFDSIWAYLLKLII